MYRKTYVSIDNKIIENNTKEIIKKYNKYKYYIGVVKNNAYHHGIKIIDSLINSGINYLAVSSLEEALEIRKINNNIPILVLEPVSLDYLDDLLLNNITITIENLDYLKSLNEINLRYNLNIHLKIDSGMNRLGFKENNEINEAVRIIKENEKLTLEGIYTHFSTSGYNDIYYDLQLENFKNLTKDINLKEIPIVHIDKSLTLVRHKKENFTTGVRLGIILYGFDNKVNVDNSLKGKIRNFKRNLYIKKHNISESIIDNNLNLHTAFSLYSTVLSLRHIKKEDIVGYNACYKAKKEAIVATIPIGYADGVTKDFKYVFINNQKYEIISDYMDMISVLVDENVKLNDKVEIFGDNISIKEVTKRLKTNSYHLFNQISNRVPIIYKNNEVEVEIKY